MDFTYAYLYLYHNISRFVNSKSYVLHIALRILFYTIFPAFQALSYLTFHYRNGIIN